MEAIQIKFYSQKQTKMKKGIEDLKKEAQLIAQNQGVLEILQFLSQHCSPQARQYDEIVLFQSRYNRIQKGKNLYSEEQYDLNMGKITRDVFSFIGLTYQPPEKKKNTPLNFILSKATLSKANVIRDLLFFLAEKSNETEVIKLISRFNGLIKNSKAFAVDEAAFIVELNRIEAGIKEMNS